MALKLNEELANQYIELLEKKGEVGLYKQAIAVGVRASVEIKNPENDILNLSEAFLLKYRVTANFNYFIISKCLRRAAHVLYREFLKKNNRADINKRFLNMVK